MRRAYIVMGCAFTAIALAAGAEIVKSLDERAPLPVVVQPVAPTPQPPPEAKDDPSEVEKVRASVAEEAGRALRMQVADQVGDGLAAAGIAEGALPLEAGARGPELVIRTPNCTLALVTLLERKLGAELGQAGFTRVVCRERGLLGDVHAADIEERASVAEPPRPKRRDRDAEIRREMRRHGITPID